LDRDHVLVLRRGLATWNAWRAENPTTIPNLIGLLLKPTEFALDAADHPLDLSGARLDRAVLRFAALSGVDLHDATLIGIDLAHARLTQAHLERADMSVASLNHADFTAAKLAGTNLSGSRLRYARLSSARLTSANMSLTDLTHAKLDGADLSQANLSNALLDYADFAGATLDGANLTGANLYNARNLTPEQLEKSIGAQSTILPPQLRSAVGWCCGSAQSPAPVWHDQTAQRAPTSKRQCRKHALALVAVSAVFVLPLGLYALIATQEHMRVATSEWQAQSRWKIVATASIGPSVKERFAAQSLAAEAAIIGVTRPVLRALPLIAEQDVTIDPHLHPPLDEEIVGQVAQSVALEPPDTKNHAVRPSQQHDRFEHADLAATETSLAHALAQAEGPAISRSDSSDVAGSHVELFGADTQEHAGMESANATMVAEHALAEIDGAGHGDSMQEFAWLMPQANDLSKNADSGGVVGSASNRAIHREPLVLVVSLRDQELDAYRGATLLATSKISSGKAGHDTRTGVFSILEKKRFHHSNLYSDAPMPWMQRLTRSGTALHAGVVPGYPASHGCIRLPFSFAPKLFEMTEVGGNVVIANDKIAPIPIEHPNLFQLADNGTTPSPSRIGLAQNESGASMTDAGHALGGLLATHNHAVDYAEIETKAAASMTHALDQKSDAPLRILITRQTERDKIIAVQNLLAAMGYLEPQRFTGRLGKATSAAIGAFQKANGLSVTGAFTAELAKQVYAVAGKGEPPAGHLFVRQDFKQVLTTPVQIDDADKPLGTHMFIAKQDHAPRLRWLALSVDGDDPAAALERIVVPLTVRNAIERKLSPGSSLIIAETAVDTAILPEGDDYLVLAKTTPGLVKPATVKPPTAKSARAKSAVSAGKPTKVKKVTQPVQKRRSTKGPTFSSKQLHRYPLRSYGGGFFPRW
jgi:uncharacterized protein YjbI with pentapeptide repeats/lipoprotein-anchoring transpeptidase ErfK/SrfK/peptidoglycan hydrolase-like protein with peptidoglycan-binding domain